VNVHGDNIIRLVSYKHFTPLNPGSVLPKKTISESIQQRQGMKDMPLHHRIGVKLQTILS